MKIFSTNAAGIKSKLKSFKNELKRSNAGIFTVQETHFSTQGKIQVENFLTFEAIRKKKNGGTVVGVHEALKPILINAYNDPFELIVVEIEAGNKEIRVISGYGPQENWTPEKREPFFQALEEEIIKAELAGKSVIVEADFNSKLGKHFIPNDPHPQSENGKLLANIIRRQKLTVANGLVACEGTVTRKRVTTTRTEESAISFVLVTEDMVNSIVSVKIDECREHVLTRLTKTKTGHEKVESDHNVIETEISLPWNRKSKTNNDNTNQFNLKNKDCQKKFKVETTDNTDLSKIFQVETNLDKATEIFMKRLNKKLHKCFNKIGHKKETKTECQEKLYNRWKELKKKTDAESKEEMIEVEEKLAHEYFDKVLEATKEFDCQEGGKSSGKLWELKKKMCPRSRDPPTAMKDKDGIIVTNVEKIKEMAVNAYEERLKNRPIKEGLEEMKELKEKLAEKVMKVAKTNKTPKWTMKEIEIVLKGLKKNKSRDPNGLANELFKEEAAGRDLKEAILLLMNRIKEEQIYPKCLELCNISSIWKMKGPRNEYASYRGIFRVSIFRSILDRLIYNDEYPNLDKNLTDSNVGARKARNVRDNIFVLSAILNANKHRNKEALDLQVYDVEQCFDALWLQEVINALFLAGFQNDKLPLLFLENRSAQVAVKTPLGITRRTTISNIIMQGSVWGSLCCVVLMDKLGKMVYSQPELLYYFRGEVAVPPLQMVDDILGIQNCSPQSLQLNTAINTFMENEKLTLSKTKCHNLHIGKSRRNCPTLAVHDVSMKDSKAEKYVGDIINNSGTNKTNLENRIAKGWGKVNQILALVKEAPLGSFRIKAGLILRQAMFLNGTLFNSEAWHGLSLNQIEAFEKLDQALLRGLIGGHSKIPIPAIYLETSQIPLRHVLASRRILYLHTILKRSKDDLISRVYHAQKADPVKGDFCLLVEEDMKLVGLSLSEEEITMMSKYQMKTEVKKKVKTAAFEYLKTTKESKSKMENLNYYTFTIQPYLSTPSLTADQTSLLLALRTRTVRGIRSDFGEMFPTKQCPLDGCEERDSLPHVQDCLVLRDMVKLEVDEVRYQDVFTQDLEKQRAVVVLYGRLLEAREVLLEAALEEQEEEEEQEGEDEQEEEEELEDEG